MRILNAIFGLIIGAVFIVGGLFIALETAIPTYKSWQAMQGWQTASATLINITGSENNTEATYCYIIAGDDYQNDRVYSAVVKDNFGSYHQDMYQHLLQLKENHQPVPIWYNPNDPGQSVIDREMRWGLFIFMVGFCSIFALIGLMISYSCLKAAKHPQTPLGKSSLTQLRKRWKKAQEDNSFSGSFIEFAQQRQSELKLHPKVKSVVHAANSSHPWLARKEWKNKYIRSGAKNSLKVMWGFALIWNAISSPLLFVLTDELKQGNYAALLALLFPLVGLLLISKAWRITREWQCYGVIELNMDPFPGSIGGHVGGTLQVNNIHDANAKFKIDLECLYSYMSGSGESRSRREDIKWLESGFAKVENTGHGVRLKFRFDVPENLPEADIEQRDAYHFWRLRVTSDISGVSLNRDYNIPVFNTQTLSKYIRHDISAQAEQTRKDQALASHAAMERGDFDDTALTRVLKFKVLGNKQLFYFPMFRNKVLTLIALIFGGGFSFAAYSIIRDFADDGVMGGMMLLFSLPFACVGLVGSIAAIYLPLNNLSVTLGNRKIKAIRRLLIIPVQYHQVASHEIKNMEVKATGSTGQGIKQIKHFKVILHATDNRKVTIAEDIDGEVLANQFKDYFCKQLLIAC